MNKSGLMEFTCPRPGCYSVSERDPVYNPGDTIECDSCHMFFAAPDGTYRARRPTWDEYFMHLAVIASMRATCDRRHVGCVIVSKDKHVLSTGYNGSAPGAQHCDDAGHLMHDDHCVRTIHAEANAVAQSARNGIALMGGTIYVTTHPCPTCLLLLASAGVLDVVILEPYHEDEDEVSAVLAQDAAIIIKQFQGHRFWERGIER